jgi:pterin-4a-carbinolamine dehydratase
MNDTEQEIRDRLARELPHWSLEQGYLQRRYATGGWRTSMLLANGISHLAEIAWHHPDLEIGWGGGVVKLRTHSEDAVTDKDFELAAMIENTATWHPAEGSALEGAPLKGQWRYLDEG